MKSYLLAIDQVTSATKAVVFNTESRIVAKGTEPLASYYPKPGFVEQDPLGIYQNVLAAVKSCLIRFRAEVSADLSQIITCAISNQRETFCLWDANRQPSVPGRCLAVQAFGGHLQPSSGVTVGTGNYPLNRFDCKSLPPAKIRQTADTFISRKV